MSIRKNTWELDGHYDLTNSGQNDYFANENILFAWGYNYFGQLGQNNTTQYSSPVQIPGTTWSNGPNKSGFLNSQAFGAIKTDGTLWVWGTEFAGSLGQNSASINYSSPIQIPGTTWSSISDNRTTNGGILSTKTDGTLWAWGLNTQGQLGQNNTISYSSPVQIPGNTWSSISSGYFSLATKTDGTLWSWGYNTFGQLGQNNTTQYSSPVQIPGTTWSSIVGGNRHALATKTDGTLWSWGYGSNGNLGQNNITTRSSPVQIPGTTWSSISGGVYSLATKTDGTLWAWGSNTYGQLGQNNVSQYSSPAQIPGNTWSSISGSFHTLSTKTDGTLWAWGLNNYGQLAQNNRTNRSSPVQIPGTTWSSANAGYFQSLATQLQ